MHEFDAYSPSEIAARVSAGGITKARLPLVTLFLLGIMAGGFVGIGALYFTIIVSDSELSFAMARLIGGICFSTGLLLVVVCGAELFTGNVLIAMAWADGSIRFMELLRNWAVVCMANFIGAAGFAFLVFLSGHWELNGGAVGATYLKIAAAKAGLPFWKAFFLGVLCNNLVCLAVWMSFAGRTVIDKFIGVVLPISAFAAAGFEHSIANMYFFPMALLLQANGSYSQNGLIEITASDIAGNLIPVIAGNIVGGSVLVALIYWLIYRKNNKST
jgi:formate transporter